MSGKNIVIALGGNALENGKSLPTSHNQMQVIKETCKHIAEIVKEGYRVTIVHGNGPQVGRLLLAIEEGKESLPSLSLDVLDSMTQGYIGYQLQQALSCELGSRGLPMDVTTVVTQVVVDKNDIGFLSPTKPIGPFYTEEEAQKLMKENKGVYKKDANRGYRKVVASPKPLEIVEIDRIRRLSKKGIVIACGGGGIPVVEEGGCYKGVEAVIDKDYAAELLAEGLKADILLILTAVDNASLDYGTGNERPVHNVKVKELKVLVSEGHFAEGSMLPKISAGIKFAEHKKHKTAVITSLNKGLQGLKGSEGTIISM